MVGKGAQRDDSVCIKCISFCSNVQIFKKIYIFKNILRIKNTTCA